MSKFNQADLIARNGFQTLKALENVILMNILILFKMTTKSV